MSRKLTTGDSLDLLLDTICNTFGGVLFVALLVAILSGQSGARQRSTPVDPQADEQLASAELELERVTAELETARQAVVQMEAMQAQFPARQDQRKLLLQWRSAQQRQLAERESRDQELDALAKSRRQVNELLNESTRLESAIRAAEAELAVLQTQRKQEIALRSQTAKLPRERTTSKQQVAFLVSAGRLCAFANVLPDGRVVPNRQEVVEEERDGVISVRPIPSQGLRISLDQPVDEALQLRLGTIQRDKHYVTLAVWPDSFREFAIIRQQLVKAGIEYQLRPWSGEQPLTVGHPTGNAKVQ